MTTNLHTAWARLFVRALAASGVRDVVVSPGSRSTPLSLAAWDEPDLAVHVLVDERVAGFFALGLARTSGLPVALVCTSGTAGAHWIPAAIEASLTGVPLVCVTADRPWEAYDCAAPQTIDQTDLLGRHARHRAELGAPDARPAALRAVARIAAQAVHRARAPLPGAVHVNARFRKPLEPVRVDAPEPWEPVVAALLARPPTRVFEARAEAPAEAVRALADALRGAARPWVVCGPSLAHGPREETLARDAVHALCARTGALLLAESTSGARFGAPAGVRAAPCFDALLRHGALDAPDLVVEVGLPATSGAWASQLEARADLPRWVVAPHGWPDPSATASALVVAPAETFLRAVCDALGAHAPSDEVLRWGERASTLARDAYAAVALARDEGALHDGAVAAALLDALPEGAVLCVGNSLPARDVDVFHDGARPPLRVLHQRGASGIDGLVAGAAGARAATDGASPVAVYLGDVSAAHDLGGLAAARAAGGCLVVVVVNNRGGRIFEQLPLGRQAADDADLGRRFDALFVTAPEVSFAHAAATFGVAYREARTREALRDALREALSSREPTLVEAVVDPDASREARARCLAAARDVSARGRSAG